MDDSVIRSMLKWPDIPDVYGWLRLDRSGNWRIRVVGQAAGPVFEPIGNPAFREFIGRNYAVDERGCWFFQNGPQRVFVSLAYLPFVFRVNGEAFADHCGRPAGRLEGAWLDEEGSLVLRTEKGAGVLDHRDLGAVADKVAEGVLELGKNRLAVGKLNHSEMEARFRFIREPAP